MAAPVVVGTDGSDTSLRAVDWAADEAAVRGAPLRVVYASLWEHYEGVTPSFRSARSSQEVLAEHIAASACERSRLRRPEVAVSTEILADDPAEGLIRESGHALAVVVGHRGRGELAGLLLGSVSLSVAARARCPVVVVRGANRPSAGDERWVVLGVGDRGAGTAAVDFAFREAAARDCGVSVVHAWRSPYRAADSAAAGPSDAARQTSLLEAREWLEDALREPAAAHPGVPVRREVVEGHARKALLDAAVGGELLVVGAQRRRGGFGLQLGPVNHTMLHHAPCPVAVVPHEQGGSGGFPSS